MHFLLFHGGQPLFHWLTAANMAAITVLYALYRKKYILYYLAWLAPSSIILALAERLVIDNHMDRVQIPQGPLTLGVCAMLG
eukprot:2832772-Rhodomonas_salina.1